jgi:predicted AlkP superfamily phosphohydrolase/phosphomutase
MGLLYRLKRRLPHHWVRPILTRLPRSVSQRMTKLWSAGMYDWAQTRYFPVPMDAAGYIRINLAGREPQGTVTADEYDELCDELEVLITGLTDAESGEPIAGKIQRPYRDADPQAPARHLLPDLVVPFDRLHAGDCGRLVNKAVPGFEFTIPNRLPSGRSGNHTDKAWLLARGPGIQPGMATETHSVLDVLPTILEWLGQPPDPDAQGKPIDFGPHR